jgi:hypothetical protein
MMLLSSNILKPTINLRTFGEYRITKNTFIFWSSRKTRREEWKNIGRIVSTLFQKYKKTFEILWILQVMEGIPKNK